MALHLKALDGPHQDKSFLLRPGFVIGRAEGDLVVPSDKRLSGRHAFVEGSDDEPWYLVDNGSKNGLRVDNVAIERVPLKTGTQILVGTYTYEVTDEFPLDAPAPASPGNARHWREILTSFITSHIPEVKNEGRAIAALRPSVVLDFVRGVQAETRWILSYGPRKIGKHSLDFPIFEPGAPDVCFEIIPTPDGIKFRTDHPGKVTLNGKSVSTEILHIADVIKIQGTEIEVDFVE